MREIKFRGFYHHIETVLYPAVKKWVYGDFFRDNDGFWIKDGVTSYRVSEKSIGQFTGLKDLMGVGIFEGDIVKWGNPKGSMGIIKGYVIFLEDLAMFAIQLSDGHLPFTDEEDNIITGLRVVGNIYKNGDLLK